MSLLCNGREPARTPEQRTAEDHSHRHTHAAQAGGERADDETAERRRDQADGQHQRPPDAAKPIAAGIAGGANENVVRSKPSSAHQRPEATTARCL
jgi:hypothetical protein